MNRQEFIELSPWLLNGSLSESEREELLAQLKESVESRTDLADTAFVASLFANRPSTEALVAMAHDEPISPVERELFDLQLELDPEIAAELELARMSRQLVEAEDVALMPVERLLAETSVMAGETGEDAVPAAEPAAAKTRVRATGWRLLAVAALAALVPSALWLHSEQQIRELQSAQTLTPAWTEINLGRVRGGGVEEVWQVERGGLVEVYPEDSNNACASCTVEITAVETGQLAYRGPIEIQRGFYQLQMHLPPGRYQVAIHAGAQTESADRPAAETAFEVEITDGSAELP